MKEKKTHFDSTDKQSQYEVAHIIRSMIDTENQLINDRIGWMMASEAFIFTGLVIIWDKPGVNSLFWLLCFLGLMVSFVAFFLLWGATRAQCHLRSWWDEYKKSMEYNGPPVMGFPLAKFPKLVMMPWLTPWDVLAVSFIIAWIIIVFIRI